MTSAIQLLNIAVLSVGLLAAGTYYPPSEAAGGWRRCGTDEEVRSNAGMDPQRLRLIGQEHVQIYGGPWAIAIVRKGYLVGEWFGVPAMPATTFDVWSSTKSATGIAIGMMLEDSRNHRLPGNVTIDLDSPAYDYVPEGYPLSDPRKAKIQLKHLLSMTSGIPGEDQGVVGIAVAPGRGEFEFALGKEPNRFGISAAKMAAEPGGIWDYSDAAFCHLSLIFAKAEGREIGDYIREHVFERIGIQNFGWDLEGGAGHIGPHTNPHSGLRLSARDFARLGYLMAHHGQWEGKQIVPNWWIDLATRSSQALNRNYGYSFWVNTEGTQWPAAPKDAFAFQGYGSNRCYVVPSLDLVVVRLGYAPPVWTENSILPAVVGAIFDASPAH
ncbi:MAG TPA: serine hydrolase [Bryobacteraceae bacterium]|nr:serine hydrolase [Bryobacteraceae bacterium]